MLTFYPVEIDEDLNRKNPLYVGNFFQLKGMWWAKRKQRQGLIVSVAVAWYRLVKKQRHAPGFIQEEVFITRLTNQVKDARVILERFFEIERLGFNFNNGNKSATLVTPKKQSKVMIAAIEAILNVVRFSPSPVPNDKGLTKSRVSVLSSNASTIKRQLKVEDREDLLPAVSWLLEQGTVDFYYKPSGKLQARDTSVWPIRAIELWPGWLRKELFGRVVDIENSYCQFLMNSLYEKYAGNMNVMKLKYPHLIKADTDKTRFREDMCHLLKLPVNEESISSVKKLVMSLANGSNATPGLMIGGSGRSEAVRIVLAANPNLSPSELVEIGKQLSFIAKQFRAAKKELCIHLLNAKPSSINMKKIFSVYFDWERKQRYKIWEAVGKTGLHLHDGVDGFINDMPDRELEDFIAKTASVRVSVETPAYLTA